MTWRSVKCYSVYRSLAKKSEASQRPFFENKMNEMLRSRFPGNHMSCSMPHLSMVWRACSTFFRFLRVPANSREVFLDGEIGGSTSSRTYSWNTNEGVYRRGHFIAWWNWWTKIYYRLCSIWWSLSPHPLGARALRGHYLWKCSFEVNIAAYSAILSWARQNFPFV